MRRYIGCISYIVLLVLLASCLGGCGAVTVEGICSSWEDGDGYSWQRDYTMYPGFWDDWEPYEWSESGWDYNDPCDD